MKRTSPAEIVAQVEKSVTGRQNISKPIVEFLSSGATCLDLALGGGFPIGKIINIVGDESTGKTLLAIEAIVRGFWERGKKIRWFYDDAEAGFSFNTREMYSMDINIVAPDDECSDTVEDFESSVKAELNHLKKEELLIYVLDSLDSLTSEAERKRDTKVKVEGGKEKGSYGLEKPKKMSEFFRKMRRRIKDKNCILIIISQTRANIGVMFGEKRRRAGGDALNFYAAQVMWLSEVQKYTKRGFATGIGIKVRVKKNKVGKPYREAFVDLLFDYGIDDISSNLIFLYDLRDGYGKLKPDKFKWDGKEMSLRQAVKYIEDKDQAEDLKAKVEDKWFKIEESIAPNRRRKYQ